ncbi:HD domain-containing phosphohydrolase [Massilia sp. IC2-476]|uniref:HD domain-containing phosphohydrolase n=1 Tax=Massilia sp. IC2-476 TaxID=2887199 RepID=UPI001D121501|nr:HD domain-containing phosphohydrolase [Massilia sp. IC2-476]MCC2974779.1 LuxR C-terminal-related transcriptional regulator [Massilia sp. IC2-476]
MQSDHRISVEEAVQLLAMVGDLSMGQPTDQSIRTAHVAERLALAAGAGAAGCQHARLVALLRWSGCTANAAGFALLMGDDVGARDALITHTLPPEQRKDFTSVAPLARIHCEVSGDIAQTLGLPGEVQLGLRRVWEHYDGGGMPERLRSPHIPQVVYHANLAGDLVVLTRAHGMNEALRLIQALADRKYPAELVRKLAAHAQAWLDAADAPPCPPDAHAMARRVPLTIVADMIELKLPWLLGYSRCVADLAERAALLAGLPEAERHCLARAALIHGIGRAAVPNAVWQRDGKLGMADWEKLRLVPYWTARAAVQVPSLRAEALLASQLYERLDGSGYYRDLDGAQLGQPQRLLSAAAAYAALCMPRPWRAALAPAEAAQLLCAEAAGGRFDAAAVNCVIAAAGGASAQAAEPVAESRKLLSEREADVLRRISLGESNKEAARHLAISPSTVRTHVESIFRKLGCSTRAAATLKALTLGLI